MSIAKLHDVAAPAKLNLFLHVVGRRADGYHLLQSLFVLIDWCDTLHFERRSDGRLTRHDLGPTLPADDLCLRAARLLQVESGSTLGADISIDKQVPWGAGMGGGSSDAASTLLALNHLWGLRWPFSRLLPLALALGADVPFFLVDAMRSSRASASDSRRCWLARCSSRWSSRPPVSKPVHSSPARCSHAIPSLLHSRAHLQTLTRFFPGLAAMTCKTLPRQRAPRWQKLRRC